MKDAQLAAVRPRILSPITGESLLLEDAVAEVLARHSHGLFRLDGGPGMGKTTALRHLAAVFADTTAAFADEPNLVKLGTLPRVRVVIVASFPSPYAWILAPWTRDEWIEYLLARHKEKCGSVMARLRDHPTTLTGNPELWSRILDAMAADESLHSAEEALEREVYRAFPPGTKSRGAAEDLACNRMVRSHPDLAKKTLLESGFPINQAQLIRHRPVQEILQAGRILDELNADTDTSLNAGPHQLTLLLLIAARLPQHPQAVEHLKRLVTPHWQGSYANHATLLHLGINGWRPEVVPVHLPSARLAGANWPGIDLSGSDLCGADLRDADLRRSKLCEVKGRKACLAMTNLYEADLTASDWTNADFRYADLSCSKASAAQFVTANLEGANLSRADLKGATFNFANLRSCSFDGADLTEANLDTVDVEGASFLQTIFDRAKLSLVNLSLAHFGVVGFRDAVLHHCNLEGLSLADADFFGADLLGCLLTGTNFFGANFEGASLRETGLADVQWENANLQRADFSDASFHLGSSRSGLVGSPIACEGSRTGFYTDDWEDRRHKDPELIRKANLCGADLRGAKVTGTDFYLVDLRGAHFTKDQYRHFQACGAILED